MWEILHKTSYLLSNVYAGIEEITGTENHADDMQMIQTVESQLMVS